MQAMRPNKNSLASALRRGLTALGPPIGDGEKGFLSRWGWSGSNTWTGRAVTADNALQNDVVWACVKLISETVSTLPLALYQRAANGGRAVASAHPLYSILHTSPSARMSAVNYWQAVSASLLLWGNAYSEIMRAGNRIISLEFLQPHLMRLAFSARGEIEFHYSDGGKTRQIAAADVFHIKSFSMDGVIGMSAIQYGRGTIGRAQGVHESSEQTYAASTRAHGIVTVDRTLTPDMRQGLREHIDRVKTEGGVYILEKGVGFTSMRLNAVDSEMIASENLSIEQICRIFRVPPVMIGHGDKASSWPTSTEAQGALFVRYVLRAILTGIEQEITRALLTPAERQTHFAKFAIEGLLRGSSAERAAFYAVMAANGLMTRDEIRALEDLPARGGAADALTVQSAMIDIEKMNDGTNAAAVAATENARAVMRLADDVRALQTAPAPPAAAPMVINMPRTPVQPQDVRLTVQAPPPVARAATRLVHHRDPVTGLITSSDVIH